MQFSQTNVWGAPKALRLCLRGGCTLRNPSPWPTHITEPGSATGECDNAFSNTKVRKRFIGDILHIVILYLTPIYRLLSVKIWCPGLVQEKLWSACIYLTIYESISCHCWATD